MGYRLEISKIKYANCGGKLFGYTDERKLKSWKWLYENNIIDGDECFHLGCNHQFVLNYNEFKSFIKLYLEDLDNYYEFREELDEIKYDLIKLSMTKCDKLIEWY